MEPGVDGRRARGDRTRKLAAGSAADLATVTGLGALSISQLAAVTGLSKSGILTVFESREAVQIAALAEARQIVLARVINPALGEEPGTARLTATVDNWFGYVRARVFQGGCFMAALSAEYAAQSGHIAALARESKQSWLGFIEAELLVGARDSKRTRAEVATALLTLDGIMLAANTRYLLLDDPQVLDVGQAACHDLLRTWSAPGRPQAG